MIFEMPQGFLGVQGFSHNLFLWKGSWKEEGKRVQMRKLVFGR